MISLPKKAYCLPKKPASFHCKILSALEKRIRRHCPLRYKPHNIMLDSGRNSESLRFRDCPSRINGPTTYPQRIWDRFTICLRTSQRRVMSVPSPIFIPWCRHVPNGTACFPLRENQRWPSLLAYTKKIPFRLSSETRTYRRFKRYYSEACKKSEADRIRSRPAQMIEDLSEK